VPSLKNVRRRSDNPMSKLTCAQAEEAETRVTDATLRLNIGYNMKRAFNVVKADLAKTLKPFDLRMLTYSALVLIVDNPGLRQTQLAQTMDMEHPNLVKILDELEERRLITRAAVKTDRRAYALQASKFGIALSAQAVEAVARHENLVFAQLSKKERASVIRVMQRVEQFDREVS